MPSPVPSRVVVAPAAALTAEPAHRYVPFLLASVALTLTFGAALGTLNLARLTTPWFGTMTPVSVQAHAFSQVFGFVGLFVMGVAVHVLPRFAGRPLGAPFLVPVVFGLQTGGVLVVIAAFMAADAVIAGLWLAGTLALVAAASMFLHIVRRTVGGVPALTPVARWVVAGAAWQVAAAAGAAAAAWTRDPAAGQAVWAAGLWGVAGSWIFGVGRRIFPGFLGWRPRAPRAERTAFALFQVGTVLTAVAAWPYAATPPAALIAAGAACLLAAVPLYSWCLGAGTRLPARHDVAYGYQRFVSAGWLWLGVALLLGPAWALASAAGVSPAPRLVADFARHALAFGFVAQVMMGIATRILPTFTGNALWSPRARSATFYLLNASLLLRSLEAIVAAGLLPEAWPFIAAAGPPAMAAVTLFALNVVLTIRPPQSRLASSSAARGKST